MPRSLRDTLTTRYRWSIAVLGVLASVALTVLLYWVTEPRAASMGGVDPARLPEGAIIRVGALPVT